MRTRTNLLIGGAIAALSVSNSALAQNAVPAEAQNSAVSKTAPAPSATNDDYQTDAERAVGDIVVRGRKRGAAERLQDVPLAISALGSEQLDARHVRTVVDIGYSIPNATLKPTGTFPGVASFFIRGQGVTAGDASLAPAVGVFNDGIYLGTIFGVVTDAFDLESIEVLRGPQGLLFGKNVSAGAVLLRTRRPDPGAPLSFKGEAGIESSGGQNGNPRYMVSGSVMGGLSSTLGAKLAVQYSDDRGWTENKLVPNGPKLGALRTLVVKPALSWQPEDDLRMDFLYEHGRIRGLNTVYQNLSVLSGRDAGMGDPGQSSIDWDQATWETNLHVAPGNGTITNIFGWRKTVASNFGDTDASLPINFHSWQGVRAQQFSNELRYAGEPMAGWNLTAGLYYFNQDLFLRERRLLANATRDATFGGEQSEWTASAFFSSDINLTKQLVLNLGGRYVRERKDDKFVPFQLPSGCTPITFQNFEASQCAYSFTGAVDFKGFIPKVGFQYEIDRDHQFYGFWTKGLRSGGFSLRNSVPNSVPTSDEVTNAFEVGSKNTFWNGRIKANLAAFYNKVDGLVRTVVTTDPTAAVANRIRNTANVRIIGVEFDGSAQITDNLSLSLAAAFEDAKYLKVLYDLSGDGIINAKDLALRLPIYQRWSASGTLIYEVPVSDNHSVVLQADWSHRERVPYNDPNTLFLKGGEVVGLSATFKQKDNRYSLSAYVRNLLNKDLDTVILNSGFGVVRQLEKGRVIGVTAGVNF